MKELNKEIKMKTAEQKRTIRKFKTEIKTALTTILASNINTFFTPKSA